MGFQADLSNVQNLVLFPTDEVTDLVTFSADETCGDGMYIVQTFVGEGTTYRGYGGYGRAGSAQCRGESYV